MTKRVRTFSIALLLCSTMMISGCAGIDKDKNTSEETEKTEAKSEEAKSEEIKEDEELTQITIYAEKSPVIGEQESWFAEILREKFGVKLIYADTSKGVEASGIDWYSLSSFNIKNYIDSGLLLNMDEEDFLNENGEYIAANYKDKLEAARAYSSDGGLYFIPSEISTGDTDFEQVYDTWRLRYDYYQEMGYPEVRNIDDWFTVICDMNKAHGENSTGKKVYSDAIWPDFDIWTQYNVSRLVTAYYGYDNIGMGFYDYKNNRYYDALLINEDGSYGPYLQMLKYYYELNKSGNLYIANSFEELSDEASGLYANDQLLTCMNDMLNMEYDAKKLESVIPADATPSLYEINKKYLCMYAISSKSPNKDKIMQIMDWMYSPEGNMTYLYGPKGLCWDYDTESGGAYFTELGSDLNSRKTYVIESDDPSFEKYNGMVYMDGVPMINSNPLAIYSTNKDSGESFYYKRWTSENVPEVGSVKEKWCEQTGSMTILENIMNNYDYVVIPVDDHNKQYDEAYNSIGKIIVDGSWDAIKAADDAAFEKTISDMIAAAKAAGYDECIEQDKLHIED